MIFSSTRSVDTFASSTTAPITILKTPYAIGSFLYSVFQLRPSIVIPMILAASASRSVSSPHGFTSQTMIDLAIGGTLAFLASAPFAFNASAAAASSSPPSANGSKSSSSYFLAGAAWAGAGVGAAFGASTTLGSLAGSTGLSCFSHIFTFPTTDLTAAS